MAYIFDLFFNFNPGLFLPFHSCSIHWLFGHAWVRWHLFCLRNQSSCRFPCLQFNCQSDNFFTIGLHCLSGQSIFCIICLHDSVRSIFIGNTDYKNLFSRKRFWVENRAWSSPPSSIGIQLSFLVQFVDCRYTLHSFYTVLIIYLLLLWKSNNDSRFLFLAALFFGLSAGNHGTVAFYLPAILVLFFGWEKRHKIKNLGITILFFKLDSLSTFTCQYVQWRNRLLIGQIRKRFKIFSIRWQIVVTPICIFQNWVNVLKRVALKRFYGFGVKLYR